MKQFLSRLIIEKPDYKTDALLSITLIYMLNEIASQLYEPNKNQKISESEWEYLKSYYFECSEILISFNKLDILKKSIKDLEEYYFITPADIQDGARKGFLKRFGQPSLIRRKSKVFRSQTKKIELPDNFILPGDFYLYSSNK
ncbi:MAG: hypothetical protein IPG21_00840 [Saprospiraceae bacterium]|nr:hypothetical protein [Candidatus Vicinibacter affinis]